MDGVRPSSVPFSKLQGFPEIVRRTAGPSSHRRTDFSRRSGDSSSGRPTLRPTNPRLQLRPPTSRDPKKILRRDLACGLHQDHSVSDNHFELCPWLDPEPLYVCGYRRPPPVSHSRCATRFFALCVTTCIPHRMFRPLDYQRSHS